MEELYSFYPKKIDKILDDTLSENIISKSFKKDKENNKFTLEYVKYYESSSSNTRTTIKYTIENEKLVKIEENSILNEIGTEETSNFTINSSLEFTFTYIGQTISLPNDLNTYVYAK